MSVITNNLLLGEDGYNISRSVRLRSSASAYFSRTPASSGNRKTWTWSGWVKRGLLGSEQMLFSCYTASTDAGYTGIEFTSADQLKIGSQTTINLITSRVFRDPSAWYHIVVAFDTTQATSSNRLKIYVNGVQETAFATASYPSLNTDYGINQAADHRLGYFTSSVLYFDGYLTEVNFIDGQALTPSSFGETDLITGVWKPKKYTGTYGTNGFFLNFSDNSNNTAATIGKDSSGNGNNWTPNNISVTSGSTYDSMLDVPTMWADGGNGRGNYAVSNPLRLGPGATLSSGNLDYSKAASGNYGLALATFELPTTGKWYWEITPTSNPSLTNIWYSGVSETSSPSTNYLEQSGVSCGYAPDGKVYYNGGSSTYGNTYTTNDVIGVAVDMDNGAIYFSKNGTWQNSGVPTSGASKTGAARTNLSSALLSPSCASSGSTNSFTSSWNFGQRPFAYTPPTGFKALNTQNLPDATIKKGNAYFDASLWTGNGTSQSITNSGSMQPDFLWIKNRGAAGSNHLYDSIRGTSLALFSDSTSADNSRPNSLSSFNSNGFTLGSSSDGNTNISSNTYVGWQWKESVSAGFDIVTYTGTGVARTVAHSLGVTPSMIIVKDRTTGGTSWQVYHRSLGNTDAVLLNSTGATFASSSYWNNTSPTSSFFTVGTSSFANTSAENYVAYLFAEVAGYSKFGSYTGNGSADGPFVYLGFRPRWVLIRNTAVSNWVLIDTSTSPYNVTPNFLNPNTSGAEVAFSSLDITSNGFKLRNTDSGFNTSSGTYIYAAFAENPFKNSLAR